MVQEEKFSASELLTSFVKTVPFATWLSQGKLSNSNSKLITVLYDF